MIKKLLFTILGICTLSLGVSLAAEQASFAIIPETSENAGSLVSEIAEGGHVWDNYKKKAEGQSLGTQFASGVMTWDTILDYIVYLMKFLGQLALLAGAVMIIYLGYEKAIKPLFGNGGKLGHIVLGVLVVTFAYVIVRIIWYMFIS